MYQQGSTQQYQVSLRYQKVMYINREVVSVSGIKSHVHQQGRSIRYQKVMYIDNREVHVSAAKYQAIRWDHAKHLHDLRRRRGVFICFFNRWVDCIWEEISWTKKSARWVSSSNIKIKAAPPLRSLQNCGVDMHPIWNGHALMHVSEYRYTSY